MNLLEALQKKDFARIARIYNGPKYEENHYNTHLADLSSKYTLWAKIMSQSSMA